MSALDLVKVTTWPASNEEAELAPGPGCALKPLPATRSTSGPPFWSQRSRRGGSTEPCSPSVAVSDPEQLIWDSELAELLLAALAILGPVSNSSKMVGRSQNRLERFWTARSARARRAVAPGWAEQSAVWRR